MSAYNNYEPFVMPHLPNDADVDEDEDDEEDSAEQQQRDQQIVALSWETAVYFDNVGDLKSYAQAKAQSEGFPLVVKGSNYKRASQYIDLGCKCHGAVRSHKSAAEQAAVEARGKPSCKSTDKTDCPFWMHGLFTTIEIEGANGEKRKEKKWLMTARCTDHNHETLNPIRCAQWRKRTPEETAWLEKHAFEKKVGRVLSDFNETFKVGRDRFAPLISKDISNFKTYHNTKKLGGLTPINYLLNKLPVEHFRARTATVNGNLSRLFLTHPKMIDMVRRFPGVLLMDCTYKTNKWSMPLLQIVGVDCCGSTFYAAWVFLTGESAEDYLWAMQQFKEAIGDGAASKIKSIITDSQQSLINALDVVFPETQHLLCVWHIAKNMLKQFVLSSSSLKK